MKTDLDTLGWDAGLRKLTTCQNLVTVLNLSVLFSHGWPSQELPSCCICFLVLIVQELFSEPDNREFFITVGRDLISRILLNAEKVSFVYNYFAVSMYMCVVRIVVIYTVSKVSL